jgi:small subunit ribosomal protein S17
MKSLNGKVVSTKMQNTIVVEVQHQRMHPLYKKFITKSKRFKVHSEDPSVKEGDMVTIEQIRPISKEKHFKLKTI